MNSKTTVSIPACLLSAALAASPAVAFAAASGDSALTTQTQRMDTLAGGSEGAVSGKISSDFSAFAGSRENADALVTGLRNGSSITLHSTGSAGATTATTFTPPTGKMGYGNVYTSLSLAKQQLAVAGISDPTPEQIQAALAGGTVANSSGQTTSLTGVLELRAQGMGWGQIAHQYGYKLGPVVSAMRASNSSLVAVRPAGSPLTTAGGQASAPGVVTAGGTAGSGQGHGHAYGRGIVTGAGTGPSGVHGGQAPAYGRGIVTGGGTAGAQAGARSAGHGKALGKGH